MLSSILVLFWGRAAESGTTLDVVVVVAPPQANFPLRPFFFLSQHAVLLRGAAFALTLTKARALVGMVPIRSTGVVFC